MKTGMTRPVPSSLPAWRAGLWGTLGVFLLVSLPLPAMGASSVGSHPMVSLTPYPEAPSQQGARALGAGPAVPLATLSGVDVSSYQGAITWSTVASDGNSFAFARAVEYYGTPDPDFTTYMPAGKAAGISMGAYDFVYPSSETATTDADYFNGIIKPYVASGYMYPALDLEEDCTASGGSLDAAQITSWVNSWATELKSDLASDGFSGVTPIVYMNSNYASNCIDASTWGGWTLWIAEYYNTCATSPAPSTGVFSTYTYWQWCSSGSTGGIDPVDQDIFNGDLSQLTSGYVFGGGGPTVSYAVEDTTTGTAEYCGDSFAAGDDIAFTASVSGGTAPYTYAWTFGDGGTGTGASASHTYVSAATVNPLLTVTDSTGAKGSTGSGCDFTVTGEAHVTVTAETSPASTGQITLNGTTLSSGGTLSLADDAKVALVADVPAGYDFSAWSVSGGLSVGSSSSESTTLTVGTTDGTVTMTVVPVARVTLTAAPASVGTFTLDGSAFMEGSSANVDQGIAVPLSATAPAGWGFSGWSVVSGTATFGVSTSATTTLTATSSSVTILATFLDELPAAPHDLTVTAVGTTWANVSWGLPPGTMVNSTLAWAPGPTLPSSGWSTLVVTAPQNETVVTQLTPGTVYWFTVFASNATGAGAVSTAVNATTLELPGTPTDLAIDREGATWVDLSWDAPTEGAVVTAYLIRYGELPGGTGLSVLDPTPALDANVTGLLPGTSYQFEVVAESRALQGPPSLPVQTVTPAASPAHPSSPSAAGPLGSFTLASPFELALVLLAVLALVVVALVLRRRTRRRVEREAPTSEPMDPGTVVQAPPSRPG